ncbi:alpha/beta hydrolase family protein [Nonomuraea endophytica]|uniref:alpha/beta hydrolase family protein n=1 Tax=Nonomuraea endophytica TaxID=714136 RepID=UPI0037CC8BE5
MIEQTRLSRRAVLGLAPAALLAVAAGSFTPVMPAPTGAHPIGRVMIHLVDRRRRDPWKPGRNRELMVTVTYPARATGGCPRGSWMTPTQSKALESLNDYLGIAKGTVNWRGMLGHARVGAPVHRRRGGLPVVLVSHGVWGSREAYGAHTEDLASHGYVVVSIDHTFEAAAVEFPGGRVEVSAQRPSPELLKNIEFIKKMMNARVADVRFVLDELERLDDGHNIDASRRPLPPGLPGSLDLRRTGMFGHSGGGFTTAEAMFHDRRIRSGINLDGQMKPPFDGSYGQAAQRGLGKDQAFLLFGGGRLINPQGQLVNHNHVIGAANPTNDDTSWASFWKAHRGWKRDFTLRDGAHESFTDLQLLFRQVAGHLNLSVAAKLDPRIGTVDAGRSILAQRAYIAAFFDLHLLGRDRHLLNGPSHRFPEIAFVP